MFIEQFDERATNSQEVCTTYMVQRINQYNKSLPFTTPIILPMTLQVFGKLLNNIIGCSS